VSAMDTAEHYRQKDLTMMKRYISGCLMGLTVAVHAQSYVAQIEVDALKKDGKSWDVAGGAPDVLLRVEGRFIPFRDECQDSYRCTTNPFATEKQTVYLEVYDRDVAADDLIGKGRCDVGERCRVGSAVVTLKKVDLPAVVLADARYDLQRRIEESVDRLYRQITTKTSFDRSLMQKMIADFERLRGYGVRLSEKVRDKIAKMMRELEKTEDQSVRGYIKELKKLMEHTPPAVG